MIRYPYLFLFFISSVQIQTKDNKNISRIYVAYSREIGIVFDRILTYS